MPAPRFYANLSENQYAVFFDLREMELVQKKMGVAKGEHHRITTIPYDVFVAARKKLLDDKALNLTQISSITWSGCFYRGITLAKSAKEVGLDKYKISCLSVDELLEKVKRWQDLCAQTPDFSKTYQLEFKGTKEALKSLVKSLRRQKLVCYGIKIAISDEQKQKLPQAAFTGQASAPWHVGEWALEHAEFKNADISLNLSMCVEANAEQIAIIKASCEFITAYQELKDDFTVEDFPNANKVVSTPLQRVMSQQGDSPSSSTSGASAASLLGVSRSADEPHPKRHRRDSDGLVLAQTAAAPSLARAAGVSRPQFT